MLIRALIVLLIALNLGAAVWWISRPPQSPPPPPVPAQGVARLQLLNEKPANGNAVTSPVATPAVLPPAAPATTPATAPATTDAPDTALAAKTTDTLQCFSLGPFADASAANAAGARLGAASSHAQAREVPGKAASGYNVSLPPAADRASAQALAQRIGSAGFDDFLLINTGEQANGIALGRYGSRDAAERRQAALVAAGFPAQISAIGNEGAAQWWLDVAAAAGTDAAALKTATSAASARSRDCAALR